MTRFGRFEFDPLRRQLIDGGCGVHLAPKAFDLLALLIEAAPRVVPKSEIHERIWRGGAVSDATLVGLIKDLRRALGDHDEAAPLIRTAHRIGYAFAAPLSQDDQAPRMSRWLVALARRIPLTAGENTIGRDPQWEVCIEDATVSRRHARIISSDSGASIEDLGSKNGTTVGEKRIETALILHDGDRIRFGDVLVTYRESPSGLPTVTRVSRVDAVFGER